MYNNRLKENRENCNLNLKCCHYNTFIFYNAKKQMIQLFFFQFVCLFTSYLTTRGINLQLK